MQLNDPLNLETGHCSDELKTGDALTGEGRGADKKLQLTLMSDGDGFSLRRGGAHLHQHYGGHSCRNGRGSVHHNAQLAMVSVSRAGVQMCNLRYRESRQ